MEKDRIDSVIDSLCKIEKTAAGILESTEKEKDNYELEVERQKAAFDEMLEGQTEEIMSKLEERLAEEKQKELSTMRANIIKKTDMMEEIYGINKDMWVDEIVSRIVKE